MLNLIAPAKLNTSLQVLSKRPDGYHEILSELVAVDLYDSIEIKLSDKDEYSFAGISIECSLEKNLAYRAVEIFRKKVSVPFSVSLKIDKRVPVFAGLGGGSSNASAILWGLNTLLGNPFSYADLLEISAELGSDCPFFFSSGRALCSGRGEKIKSLHTQSKKFTLLKPTFGVSSGNLYKNFCLDRDFSLYKNHLELLVEEMYPEIVVWKKDIETRHNISLQMTGSGSVFFTEDHVETLSKEKTFLSFVSELHKQSENSWFF